MVEIFFGVVLPFLLELLTYAWIDRHFDGRQYVISEEFKYLIGFPVIAGILGGAIGGLSTMISSHYWIKDESLQKIFLLVAPLVAGALLWGWTRFRRHEKRQGQFFVFACGALFFFGYLLARTVLCRWN